MAAADTVYTQKTSERKRKVAERLNSAVVESTGEEITPWSGAASRGDKPMRNHEELPDEFKEYITWHNARREARRRKPTEDEALRNKEGGAEGVEADKEQVRTEKSMFHGKARGARKIRGI